MDEWYVLKTKSQQELRAVENLQNQGFEPYCPLMKRKNKNRLEPLFPGYIFLLHGQYAGDLPWDKVRSTRGVASFIRFGLTPATVSDELVEGLRDQERIMGEQPVFKPGQIVVFKDGPFAELQGIYLCDKGEERCMVLLNILSRDQPVLADQVNIR